MTDAPTIPICFSIVSHGHGELLHHLLAELNAQPPLFGARVVVTLNLADEVLNAIPYDRLDLCVLRNENPKGFAANHNAAFALCNAPWFGILNPDLVLVNEEPFSTMLARIADHPYSADVGLIAPRVLTAEHNVEDSVRANLTPWDLLRRAIGGRNPLMVQDIDSRCNAFYWVAGMCMLVRSNAFRSIGGFDERFFLYCEDYDLCARLYSAGWSIRVDTQATIIHEARRDSHRVGRHLRMHVVSLVKVWLSVAFWHATLLPPKSRPGD